MKPISDNLLRTIQLHIKNGLDISYLIKNIDIRGLDLSNSIIKDFNIVNGDISKCNFSKAIIGEDNKITNLCGTNMNNCCFKNTRFLGTVRMRRCKCRNCNFAEAYMPYVEYQYADFTDATFCDTVFRIGSRVGIGAIFSTSFFQELSKHWGISINVDVKTKSKESTEVKE
jgi:uncharacterized protein YjbI with pentapeptide repeats